jgi:hypothetical protein
MAILLIAFLTVTIAAAYSATSSEVTVTAAQRGESRAYMVAQAGLESFMARRNEAGFCSTQIRSAPLGNPANTAAPCGFPPMVQVESVTVPLPGGYADVTATRVRVATSTTPAIYLLRSRGVDTASKMLSGAASNGATARAERTVAQYVFWNVNQVNVLAGWMSESGLDKQGSSGTISGYDGNVAVNGVWPPGCPPSAKQPVAGIAVPDGDASLPNNVKFQPDGVPAVQYLGTAAQTAAAIRIDWNGMVNGDRIQPDFTLPANSTVGWPTAKLADPNYYPVIRVNGDFTLPSTGGRGTLIVMGDLTISGSNMWNGIIMVGGQMTSNGNGTMSGAVMSGLNMMLTPAQLAAAQTLTTSTLLANPPRAQANGTKNFQYNSCEVAKAAGGLSSYSVFPNAWMDNFVTY